MAIDAFVQFKDGGVSAQVLNGETQDKAMKALSPTPFDISEWSFGISQTVNMGSASGGASSGKVSFDPFTIKKVVDKSSPFFFATLCTGGHYKSVNLLVRKSGVAQGKSGGIYFEINFYMAFITKIDWSHDDAAPTEEITFDYGAMQLSYKKQMPTGGLDTKVTATAAWNKLNNSKEWPPESGQKDPVMAKA
jgi:type VI secretion system Hcp family effector